MFSYSDTALFYVYVVCLDAMAYQCYLVYGGRSVAYFIETVQLYVGEHA